MIKFFHHLLNPHCEHCREERETEIARSKKESECPSCNILVIELEKAQKEKAQLLAQLFHKETEVTTEPSPIRVPLNPGTHRNFNSIRTKLEADARRRAEELKKQKQDEVASVSIKSLEEELGVEEHAAE